MPTAKASSGAIAGGIVLGAVIGLLCVFGILIAVNFLHPMTMALQHGRDQSSLGRKVMVDAGLADAEAVGDVLVAEGAVAASLDQRLGEIENLFGGF